MQVAQIGQMVLIAVAFGLLAAASVLAWNACANRLLRWAP
jgi:hypothetical protein